MTRHLRTERRQVPRARLSMLILAVLMLPGFVRVVLAAAPLFQGTFTSPGMCSPRGIALTPSGEVMVGSDCLASHLARFTVAGVFVGDWGLPQGFDGAPNGVAVDGPGNVFVTDTNAGRVYKVTGDGIATAVWSTTISPVDLAVNGSGDVFVAALDSRRVDKFTNNGVFLATLGSAGGGVGQYLQPVGLGMDASGRLYLADPGRGRVLRFLPTGSFDMEFAPPASPSDVAVGPDGNVYVITTADNVVYQYSPSGVLLRSFQSPAGMDLAWRITISSTGAIYITEQRNNRVTMFQIDMTTSASRMAFGRLKALYR